MTEGFGYIPGVGVVGPSGAAGAAGADLTPAMIRTAPLAAANAAEALAEARKAFRRANQLERAAYFEGAETSSRRGSGWSTIPSTLDDALVEDLDALRVRSRHLWQSDGFFGGAVEGAILHAIGTGFTPDGAIREVSGPVAISEAQAEAWNTELEQIWEEVAKGIGANGLNLRQSLEVALWHHLVDGDAPIIWSDARNTASPLPLTIQVQDPWLLSTPSGADPKKVRIGVERDKFGAPIRYFFRRDHESSDATPVPAERVMLLKRTRWAGQSRGLPWITSSGNRAYDVKTMDEVELISAQVAACYALFVKGTEEWGEDDVDATGRRFKNLEPGAVIFGREGEDVTPLNPQRQSSGYIQFQERNQRAVAAGLNYPFELMAMDYSKTNYSSGRLSLIHGRLMFEAIQRLIIEIALDRIWARMTREAVIAGLVSIPPAAYAAFPHLFNRCQMTGPGWAWIDPVKDVAASREAIANGLSTWSEEARLQGKRWQDLLKQQKRERKAAADAGVPYPIPAVAATLAAPAATSSQPADAGDQADGEAGQNDGGNDAGND